MKPKAALLATAFLVSFSLVSGPAAQPGKIKWASAKSRSGGDAFLPALSANGRSVAFLTHATNPIGRRVSSKSDGSRPAINGDGRYVAYSSNAANVADDTNGVSDIFVYDRETSTTKRVSVSDAGSQGDGVSSAPAFSADGRFVAFESAATNLVAGDTNALRDIFVYDRQTGAIERVSVNGSGNEANGAGFTPALSADGRFVAFASEASNLVAGDTNNRQDIFVRDRRRGTTERVSIADTGVEGNGDSALPAISADGQWVAFISRAGNLVANDTKGMRDIFVHDRRNGTTERVSVHSTGDEGNGASGALSGPGISASGRFVVFSSLASNLVSGDGNGARDIFVHDRMKGTTERLNADGADIGGNGPSLSPAISADGRYVAFASDATNLAPGDTNGLRDIYVHDRGPDPAVAFRASQSGAGLILAGGVESNGAERGPAFQLFGLTGALRLTRFVVDPEFLVGLQFELANLDGDGSEEIIVGGRESSSETEGPAFELYESDGSLKGSYPVLNPDFTELGYSAIDLTEPAVLVCGTETNGGARGPAFQLFDGNGIPMLTRFALNPDFAGTACLGADLNADGGDEIVVSGREVSGFARGPAFQVFGADGSVYLTRFALNPDFSEVQVSVADVAGPTVIVAGRETSGHARGPAFQLFDVDGTPLITRFALNRDFTQVQVLTANIDGVGGQEVVMAGRETGGLVRGPAFQVFGADGRVRLTRFALNPDFTDAAFYAIDINDDGADEILATGRETAGLARGPAFQLFDGNGRPVVTRFVLNENFTEVTFFAVPRPDGSTAIGAGGFEAEGLARGPMFQLWTSGGNLLFTTSALNSDF